MFELFQKNVKQNYPFSVLTFRSVYGIIILMVLFLKGTFPFGPIVRYGNEGERPLDVICMSAPVSALSKYG